MLEWPECHGNVLIGEKFSIDVLRKTGELHLTLTAQEAQ